MQCRCAGGNVAARDVCTPLDSMRAAADAAACAGARSLLKQALQASARVYRPRTGQIMPLMGLLALPEAALCLEALGQADAQCSCLTLQALEAFALAEEPSNLEEFEDPTQPEALDASRLQRAEAFKVRPYRQWELVFGIPLLGRHGCRAQRRRLAVLQQRVAVSISWLAGAPGLLIGDVTVSCAPAMQVPCRHWWLGRLVTAPVQGC